MFFPWCPLVLVLSVVTSEKGLAPLPSFPPIRHTRTEASSPSNGSRAEKWKRKEKGVRGSILFWYYLLTSKCRPAAAASEQVPTCSLPTFPNKVLHGRSETEGWLKEATLLSPLLCVKVPEGINSFQQDGWSHPATGGNRSLSCNGIFSRTGGGSPSSVYAELQLSRVTSVPTLLRSAAAAPQAVSGMSRWSVPVSKIVTWAPPV